jgi:hypothetical protein
MQQRHSTPAGGVPYPVENVDEKAEKGRAGWRWFRLSRMLLFAPPM